ncbi:serine/threonine-protein kinase [Pseudomonas costantinii]|uniref:Serine/threonine protein kinase n=1 Tax=Pseudomonas costantinii TaxID=168469 RepID=A0A1S2V3N2_9PSED|nr:serine/threonine-protein kinase [Pseudomonas costantinii]NVZ22042.1 serine/threonine protein kinase [Pseudomonas costantinii]NVZ71001.1 serine/threonine protein kinase [Pseudomonas costantinii]OIN53333.1 serine/threonine protein kinase [Pseudomonas costantinii]SEE51728.1 serine/threonine-protein kinase Stk1 [Pseudomonas costantinii]
MSEALAPSSVLAGRYRLERELGRGGMGVVYRARDLLHEQFGEPCSSVALKLLGETFSECPDAHVLLYSEFALTRSLCHERVVRTFSFEVDTARQSAFFTMELMHGITLDRLLLECPDGLSWRELQPMAMQLLDALVYVHQHNVLHGDVKPANVMVSEEGVRLFDFGLGHSQAQVVAGLPSLSRNRFNAWTPAYAAPELLAGGALTAAADLYGVACVLYELANGKRLGERQPTQRLPRPRRLPRHCWPALSSALAVDPERRTITVAELREVMGSHRRPWYL